MNQTNIKVDPDDKKMKLDGLVVKVSSAQFEEISSYIFLSGLITKLVIDFYSVFLSLFPIFSLISLFPFIYPSSFSLSPPHAVHVG